MDELTATDRLAEILASLRSDSSGLPDLPALLGNWETQEQTIQITNFSWTNIAPANPSRWLLSLSMIDGTTFQWTTIPDDVLQVGSLQTSGTKVFKYKDYASFLANDFYVVSKSATLALTVIYVNLRLTGKQ